jgi:hypothetical protein
VTTCSTQYISITSCPDVVICVEKNDCVGTGGAGGALVTAAASTTGAAEPEAAPSDAATKTAPGA